jgi:hypothetical protein
MQQYLCRFIAPGSTVIKTPTIDLVDLIGKCGERPPAGGLFLLSQRSTNTLMTTLGHLDIIEVARLRGSDAHRRKRVEDGVPTMDADHPWRNISNRAAPDIASDEWIGGEI